MRQAEFEQLVLEAGLTLEGSMLCGPVFLASRRIRIGWTTHVQLYWMEYRPGEFQSLTRERAQSQIETIARQEVKL